MARWLVATSVWLVAFAPRYRVDFLHVLFIGGFSLLILAVGTRVTLSHGGHDLAQERRSWPLRIGLTMGLTAMLARIGAPFATTTYFEHLAFAANQHPVPSDAYPAGDVGPREHERRGAAARADPHNVRADTACPPAKQFRADRHDQRDRR